VSAVPQISGWVGEIVLLFVLRRIERA